MKIRSKLLIRLAGQCVALASRTLFRTIHVTVWQTEPGTSPYDPTDEKFLYCIWHDGILGVLFSGDCCRMAGLVSQHEDGSYVADAMEAIGIRQIRGSSNKGGTAALKEMMEAAAEYHIAIATDGPRGPRRTVKDGIIFLASKTGRRIVPVAFAGGNSWKPKGRWTDLAIPKPFSRTLIAAGEVLSVPGSLNRQSMAEYREELQRRMDDLNQRIEAAVRDPSVKCIEQTRPGNVVAAIPSDQVRKAA